MRIVPVILSGGSGTRLWPLSRAAYPKQFLRLSENPLTLIQQTAERARNPAMFTPPLIICNSEHRFIVAEQLRAIDIASPTIILEPAGRNTAPALTIAALALREIYGEDALMLAMPSDHIVTHPDTLMRAVESGREEAARGSLITFGIKPSHPETAYGYIHRGEMIGNKISRIAKFVEKPDTETAQSYMDSGEYVWNSGMFLFSAAAYLGEIKRLKPEIAALCAQSLAGRKTDLDFIRLAEAPFLALPSISVDYAVMEATDKGAVIEVDCGWSDLGAWDALWQIHSKDASGNAVTGAAHLLDTKNSYIRSEGAAVSTLGVENLIIISTKDAVMVAHKDRAQDVKALVEQLTRENKALVEHQHRVYRPWGNYESIDTGDRYQVKRLTVKPHEKLSVQMHHHRAEHWIVVRGTAKVMLDEQEFILAENQSLYIPIGARHSLENTGDISLEIIEVQSGRYLGEDDIVRFEDRYGRKSNDMQKNEKTALLCPEEV